MVELAKGRVVSTEAGQATRTQPMLDQLKLGSLAVLAGVSAFALSRFGATYFIGYIEIALIAFSFQMSSQGKFCKYLALVLVILALNLSEITVTILYRSHKLYLDWHEGGSPPSFYAYSTLLQLVLQNTTGCLIHFLWVRILLKTYAWIFRPFAIDKAYRRSLFAFSLRSLLTATLLIALFCMFPLKSDRVWSLQFLPSDFVVSATITLYCMWIANLGTRLSFLCRNILPLLLSVCVLLFVESAFATHYHYSKFPVVHWIESQLTIFITIALFAQAAWAWIATWDVRYGISTTSTPSTV